MEEMLQEAYYSAKSVEDKPQEVNIRVLGRIYREPRVYLIYIDTEGKYWYETRFLTESGKEISEYEHIFGARTELQSPAKKCQ